MMLYVFLMVEKHLLNWKLFYKSNSVKLVGDECSINGIQLYIPII